MAAFGAHDEDTATVLRRVLTKSNTLPGQGAPGGEPLAPLVLTPDLRVDASSFTAAPHGNLVSSVPSDSVRPVAEDVIDVIDEAMLQEIVAQFVRQELQGELGEKITHNIRKLVRAELAREIHLRELSGHSSSNG